jgi:hypothetical protein
MAGAEQPVLDLSHGAGSCALGARPTRTHCYLHAVVRGGV